MGVYIDYSFYAECPEPELLARLTATSSASTMNVHQSDDP